MLKKGGVNMIKKFLSASADDESGQGMVEYGLIVGLIAIIVIAVFVALGPQINSMFEDSVSEESVNEAQTEIKDSMESDTE